MLRKLLPSFEARRRLALSLRLTRTPETMAACGSDRSIASSLGISAGVVLAVAVQGDDDLAARRLNAAANAAALAQVAAVAQHPQLGNLAFQRRQGRSRAVGRAVVDEQDFMAFARQRGGDFPGQGADIAGLVLDRDNHG